MMELHKGYWICGSAVPGPPNTTHWLTQASVCERQPKGNFIEIVRVRDEHWCLRPDAWLEAAVRNQKWRAQLELLADTHFSYHLGVEGVEQFVSTARNDGDL